MKGLFRHYRIRMGATLASPAALTTVVLTGVAGIIFWPGPMLEPGTQRELVLTLMTLLWLTLWPVLACTAVGGRVAGGRSRGNFFSRAVPSLPISPRARAVSETLVVLTFLLLLRLPALLLAGVSWLPIGPSGEVPAAGFGPFMVELLVGALLLTPMLLAWCTPVRSWQAHGYRPLSFTVVIWFAIEVGLMAKPANAALIGGCLTILAIWQVPLVWRLPRWSLGSLLPAGPLMRTHRPPEELFRRDLWLRPLPYFAVGVAGEGVVFLLDPLISPYWEDFFFIGSLFVATNLLSLAVLRPLRSKLATAGAWGLPCYQPGAMLRALSVLPIRPERILRGVYLHGLIGGGVLWLMILGMNASMTWRRTGQWALEDRSGDPMGLLLLPLVALAPCFAGFLTYATVGDRARTRWTGAFLLLLPAVHIIASNNDVPLLIHLSILALIAGIVALPPVRFLRTSRAAAL